MQTESITRFESSPDFGLTEAQVEQRKRQGLVNFKQKRITKTHFDMYLGLANPMPQGDLNHEFPSDSQNMQQMGNWLNKRTPYGAYVFEGSRLVSKNMDAEQDDDIEPPNPNPPTDLVEKFRPPYHKSWRDTDHPYGNYLFFNDRNAPVRYDRALGWSKPFEDQCNHRDYSFSTSTDLIRSAVASGGNRMIFGSNGVFHVFDATMGRMDFNAETLEDIPL